MHPAVQELRAAIKEWERSLSTLATVQLAIRENRARQFPRDTGVSPGEFEKRVTRTGVIGKAGRFIDSLVWPH